MQHWSKRLNCAEFPDRGCVLCLPLHFNDTRQHTRGLHPYNAEWVPISRPDQSMPASSFFGSILFHTTRFDIHPPYRLFPHHTPLGRKGIYSMVQTRHSRGFESEKHYTLLISNNVFLCDWCGCARHHPASRITHAGCPSRGFQPNNSTALH